MDQNNKESTDSCSSLLVFQLLQPLLQVGRALSVSRTRRAEAGVLLSDETRVLESWPQPEAKQASRSAHGCKSSTQ